MAEKNILIVCIIFSTVIILCNVSVVFSQESKEDKIATLEAKINEMQVRYEEQINKILEQYSETQQQLEKALKMIEELKKEGSESTPERKTVVEKIQPPASSGLEGEAIVIQPLEEKTKGTFDISEFLEEKKVGPVEWHGRLEGRYVQVENIRDADGTVTDKKDFNSFEQSTFALWAGIDITNNIEVVSEMEFEPAGGEEQKIKLDQARLTWDLIELPTFSTLKPEHVVPWGLVEKGILSFTFGKFYYPFGIERFSYSGPVNKLIDRPSPFKQIIPGTYSDVGAKIHGLIPIYHEMALRYEAALTNGLAGPLSRDRENLDNNDNKQIGGRLGLSLTEWLEIGSSVITEKYRHILLKKKASHHNEDMNFIGADARITYDKIKLLSSTTEEIFDLRGEYVFSHVNQPSIKRRDLDFSREGWYIQTAYKFEFHKPFVDYLELVFRYDTIDDDIAKFATQSEDYKNPNNALRELKPILQFDRYAFGIGWSPFKHFKIKGEYEISDEHNISEVDNNAVLYEMTVDW